MLARERHMDDEHGLSNSTPLKICYLEKGGSSENVISICLCYYHDMLPQHCGMIALPDEITTVTFRETFSLVGICVCTCLFKARVGKRCIEKSHCLHVFFCIFRQ